MSDASSQDFDELIHCIKSQDFGSYLMLNPKILIIISDAFNHLNMYGQEPKLFPES